MDEMSYIISTYKEDLLEVFGGTKNLASTFFSRSGDIVPKIGYPVKSKHIYDHGFSVRFYPYFGFDYTTKESLSDFSVYKVHDMTYVRVITPFTRHDMHDLVIAKEDELDLIIFALKEESRKGKYAVRLKDKLIGVDLPKLKQESVDFLLDERLREYCISKSIPLKRGIVLEGDPGNGKTSAIKELEKLAYVNNINFVVFNDFEEFQQTYKEYTFSLDKKNIFVFEDFDSYVLERGDYVGSDALGFILNTIDGVKEISNTVNIFTTNKINNFDKAFLRPGRVDAVIKFSKPNNSQIKEFFEEYLDENIVNDKEYFNILLSHVTGMNVSYAELKGVVDDIHLEIFYNNLEPISIDKALAIVDNKLKGSSKNIKRKEDNEFII